MAELSNAPYSDPGPPPAPAAADDDRFELERMLMDADRMMMQMVTLSLSLIGFGFSINTFFRTAAEEGAVANADLTARRLGLALLIIGLLFLSMSIWGQARYRAKLIRRYGLAERASAWRAAVDGRVTPTFLTALLLLIVGLSALASIMLARVS